MQQIINTQLILYQFKILSYTTWYCLVVEGDTDRMENVGNGELTLPFTLGEGSVVASVDVLQVVREVDIVCQWKRNTCLLAKTPETVRVLG